MENKILLIDGHNLLFQMFFGMPSHIYNSKGVGIWGVIGFVGALRKIISQIKPTHLAVIFDGEHENVRKGVNTDYKANRPDYTAADDEENPFAQLPFIYKALEYLNIPFFETSDCETDDLMAAYAVKLGRGNKLVISSFDSDFFQLINENVSIFRYHGDSSVYCDECYIYNKFGISASRYADFKSLTGDTADNIRGADKIGPKTAKLLLDEFGDLESIIRSSEKIERPAIKKSIEDSKDRLRDNYKIIKLSGDHTLPFELCEMEYNNGAFSTSEVLRAIELMP